MKMQIEPPKAEVLIFGCIMNPPFFFSPYPQWLDHMRS